MSFDPRMPHDCAVGLIAVHRDQAAAHAYWKGPTQNARPPRVIDADLSRCTPLVKRFVLQSGTFDNRGTP
jgi:hypothetical protein